MRLWTCVCVIACVTLDLDLSRGGGRWWQWFTTNNNSHTHEESRTKLWWMRRISKGHCSVFCSPLLAIKSVWSSHPLKFPTPPPSPTALLFSHLPRIPFLSIQQGDINMSSELEFCNLIVYIIIPYPPQLRYVSVHSSLSAGSSVSKELHVRVNGNMTRLVEYHL